jgi:hypothetical protein
MAQKITLNELKALVRRVVNENTKAGNMSEPTSLTDWEERMKAIENRIANAKNVQEALEEDEIYMLIRFFEEKTGYSLEDDHRAADWASHATARELLKFFLNKHNVFIDAKDRDGYR